MAESTIGVISIGMSVGTAGLKAGLSTASSAVSSFASSTRSTIDSVVTGFAKIGLAIEGVKKIAGLLSMPLSLAAEMEQTTVAFNVFLGSAEAAKNMVGELNKFSAVTPYEPGEVNESAKKLLGFKFSAEQVIPTLTSLGDVASGLQVPLSELTTAYGKAKTAFEAKGKMGMEDINPFLERGISLESEFVKKVASGKATFAELEAQFTKLTSEGGMFFKMMEKQSATLGGKWSTFTGNLKTGLANVGQSLVDTFQMKGLLDFANAQIEALLPVVQNVMKSVGTVVQGAVAYLKELWAEYGPTIITAFNQAVAYVKPLIESIGSTLVSVGGMFMNSLRNIGSAVMSVLGPVFENIKPVAEKFVAYMVSLFQLWKAAWGVTLTAIGLVVEYLKPLFTTIASVIMDALGKAYDFATPLIQGLTSFFQEKLIPAVESLTPVFQAMGAVASASFQALYEIVSNVVSYIMKGFQMMGEYIGEAIGWVSDSLSGVGLPSFEQFRDAIVDGLIILEYGWKNWQTVGEYTLKSVAVALIAFGAEVVHTFTKRIPAVVMWFGENWKEILHDVGEFTLTVFKNLGSNIVKIIKNIPALIKGNVSFADLWTPLLEGAEFQLKELPDIPERQMGEMEKALRKDVASLGNQLAEGAGEYLNKRRAELFPPEATKEAEKFSGVMKKMAPADVMPAQEEMKKQAQKTGEAAAGAIQGELDKIKPPSAVLFGSAEAAKLIAENYSSALGSAKVPKIEAPKVEAPKIETPKHPIIEAPKVEPTAPQIQTPQLAAPIKLAAPPAQALAPSVPVFERGETTTAPPSMMNNAMNEVLKKLETVNQQQLLELQQQTVLLNRIASDSGIAIV